MLATKLSCFEPHVTQKKRFAFLCLKYAACSFIVGKICFGLFAVKLGCFRCYFTGKRLSASLQGVTLILLDPFSKTIGKHVWVCWQRNWKFRTLSQKRSDLGFPRKVRCFKLHTTKNMFWLVGTKIGFFEIYIAKNSDFAFCLLKHVALTERSVRRKVVSFPALLHGKKVFLQFAASHPAFLLILLKTTFFLVIG